MRSRIQGARALVRLMGSSTTASPANAARRGVASSSSARGPVLGALLRQPTAESTKARSDAAPAGVSLHSPSSGVAPTPARNATQTSSRACPPPVSLSNVAEQAFLADYRPLLAHNVTHTRPKSADVVHRRGSSSHAALEDLAKEHASAQEQRRSDLDAEMEDEMEAMDESRSLACSILQTPQSSLAPKWNKALSGVSQASFERAIDALTHAAAAPVGAEDQRSAAVVHEAHRLSLEQRIAAHKAYLLAKARARGEETDLIEALGFEANVVVLGEPKGPAAAWGAGVATLLSEHTRPMQPPPAPAPLELGAPSGSAKPDAELEALSAKLTQTFIDHARPLRSLEYESVDTTEPNLFLSHALVQTQLPRLLAWDRIEAQMDGALWSATNDAADTQGAMQAARKGINLKELNATELPQDVQMDSVRRKRKKKMRKQKYRKLRKSTRIERRRQKKD